MNIIVIKCTLGAAFSFLCPNIFPFPAHRDAIGSDMRYTRTVVIIIIINCDHSIEIIRYLQTTFYKENGTIDLSFVQDLLESCN